jgi:hypothetical protein
MKKIYLIMPAIALISLSCTGDKPLSQLEATDEEAIYNVVMVDYGRLAHLEILPTTLPDTLEFMANPDSLHPLGWHNVTDINESFDVNISDQLVQSPYGLVYQGVANYTKTWTGTFEILRYNGEADSLERYTKDFTLRGTRTAICQKWGITSQRRGWHLTSIGDARYESPGHSYPFLDHLYFHADSNPESVFVFGIRATEDLIEFESGEELTIRFEYHDPHDLLLLFIPANNYGYQLAEPQPRAGGGFEVVFSLPQVTRIYGQIRILVVNAGQYESDYKAIGFSYNYRI